LVHAASAPQDLGISQSPARPRSSAPALTEFGGNTVQGQNASTDIDVGEQDGGRKGKRLLLITAFSPLLEHGHAADDLGRQLVAALSSQFELEVYAPDQGELMSQERSNDHVTYHPGSAPTDSGLRHIGLYPAGLRKDWSRKNTTEVRKLISKRRPDFIHVEYLQGVESVLKSREQWSITLHDITSTVFKQRARAATGAAKVYRWAEYLRVYMLERRVAVEAGHVFALSSRDAAWIQRASPEQSVSHVRIGIDVPTVAWTPTFSEPSIFVFAGAMWRESNVAAAEFLAMNVMPLVWQTCPTAVLRIVGTRPTARVLALTKDHRIEVPGKVDSIEDEYLRAAAVLAPTLVDAGVLLKALRGLACGAPLILNSAAAIPLGVEDGVECYVRDTAESMAQQMIEVSTNPASAQATAKRGAIFVRRNFSWDRYGSQMSRGIGS
jgi:glycosyltransferase involved in cell wall biosynthesis